MSETHRRAEKQFDAAKANLERVRKIPEADEYPVGTVIRWKNTGDWWNAAIKRRDLTWGGNQWDWSQLTTHLANSEEWEVSSAWVSDYVDAPQVHVSLDGNHEYVLVDTNSGDSWIHDGNGRWVKQQHD